MSSTPPASVRRLHPAWIVAGVAFLALVGAAGFRAAPSVFMVPIEAELGFSRTDLSLAIGINIVLYGLTAPFAAALMDRFGLKRVTFFALILIALGAVLGTFATAPFVLWLTWGGLIGIGTGSMAMVFAAQVTQRWFAKRRGLVSGVLSAGSATGQLVFLPPTAWLATEYGWREASLVVAAGALIVVPLVAWFLHDSPARIGVLPYGADPADPPAVPERSAVNPALLALRALREAARHRTFWALAVGFAVCGASTNGLIGAHFIPAAHDHGMTEPVAAGLLATVGIFDIVGTVASGWLTDRVNPRLLLAIYYGGRGVSLLFLPFLLSAEVQPPMWFFIIFYGLDWVATVPPTIALCREIFGERGPLVFGWVFASHQLGAGVATVLAGIVRDATGQYTIAWFAAAGLCVVAALVSLRIRRGPIVRDPDPDPVESTPVS
ncbi:MFS transporter [Microbacterium stercoris]|uniref:MFS transporter n=1 Tax=Microbacterium stercoris TaxID=2820289 RepID=A0A939QT03_9MICO|nr:MFS transporter [Microbacterium stercoris]MBO3664628.1 MFS transporter [Microbacterium stercoris]